MALAFTELGDAPHATLSGARVIRVISVTTDTDYAAGGYALTAASLGMGSIEFILFAPSGGYVPEYDYANSKLKVMYGNYDAADGPLIEVADGLNGIADVAFRGIVIGTKL